MSDLTAKPSRHSGQPHNNFFIANFKTAKRLRPLLKLALAAGQREGIDWDTLTVRSNNLTQPQELRGQHADLVASARLKRYPEVWIGFVVEHKSSADPNVMFQLLGYETAVYRQRVRQVFSVIVYHGLRQWFKEPTFGAYKRAGLPAGALSGFEQGRMDFEAILVWLRDPAVQEQMKQLPMEVQLLLHVMAEIWESTVQDLEGWFKRFQPLPEDEELELSWSVFEYFLQVRGGVYKIQEVKHELEAMEPGDERMQMIQEKWLEWLPLTVVEVRNQGKKEGLEEGRTEGLEEGLERGLAKGAQQMAIEMARRCIEDGMSDDEIQRYTRLTPVMIKGLRNGRNDSGD